MWSRFLIKGIQILGRTFTEAWKETGKRTAERAANGTNTIGNISIKESKDILGLTSPFTPEALNEKFEYLYKANEKTTGGSLYLQAKVSNAKIRLEAAIQKNEPLD